MDDVLVRFEVDLGEEITEFLEVFREKVSKYIDFSEVLDVSGSFFND